MRAREAVFLLPPLGEGRDGGDAVASGRGVAPTPTLPQWGREQIRKAAHAAP